MGLDVLTFFQYGFIVLVLAPVGCVQGGTHFSERGITETLLLSLLACIPFEIIFTDQLRMLRIKE
jgi:hypothetical protein